MRVRQLVASGAVVFLGGLLFAAPAGASLSVPCQASGVLKSDGVNYNARNLPDVVTIQAKDSVAWKGSVPGSGKRAISGKVYIDMPFGSIEVGTWDNPES